VSTASLTLADVRTACETLPEPEWHAILPDHPTTPRAATRHAATLVPVTEAAGEAAVIITQRAATMDHGGDWVFPGGALDDDDPSHLDAARREAAEELGLDEAAIAVIGQLATRGPIVTGFQIETYIGAVDPSVPFTPDPREVADVATLPLRLLLDQEAHHRGPPLSMSGISAALLERFPDRPPVDDLRHYRIREDEYLWGLQADILHEFLHHLTGGAHDF